MNMKIDYEYINELKKVIDSNKDKRINIVTCNNARARVNPQ